ncbi:hypothetical protein HDV02_001539 [Globomyces sp. JEL0801]|nr:hypothetical protein HDV02_001539 [Globomyces sp. JEL0801]
MKRDIRQVESQESLESNLVLKKQRNHDCKIPTPNMNDDHTDVTHSGNERRIVSSTLDLSLKIPVVDTIPIMKRKSIDLSNDTSYYFDSCLLPNTPIESLPPLMVPSPRSKVTLPKRSKQLQSLLSKESSQLPSIKYQQKCLINPTHRQQMIEFMTRMATRVNYIPETIYVAINLFDRYHDNVNVTFQKQHYLVATTCVILAGKMLEELAEPTIRLMLHDSRFTFTIVEVKRMERKITKQLEWNLNPVTPHTLLHELLTALGFPDPRIENDSKMNLIRISLDVKLNKIWNYLLPLPSFCSWKPSMILYGCLDYLQSVQSLDSKCIGYHLLLPKDKNVDSKLLWNLLRDKKL